MQIVANEMGTTDIIGVSDAELALIKAAMEEARYILDGGRSGIGSRWQSINLGRLTLAEARELFDKMEAA